MGDITIHPKQEFLNEAKKFFTCRKTLTNYWEDLQFESIREQPSINLIEINDSTTNTPHYNPSTRQFGLNGNVVETLKDLYDVAEIAEVHFRNFLSVLLSDLSLDVDILRFAPLKDSHRAKEKATDDYSSRVPGPAISWLFDIVRASYECTAEKQITDIASYLRGVNTGFDALRTQYCIPSEDGFLSCENGVGFKLMRLKNRFVSPTAGGFRDMNINIHIRWPKESDSDSNAYHYHMCELQIHFKPLKEFSKSLHSHDVYSYFRTYFRGNEAAVNKRLDLMNEILGEGSSDESLEQIVESMMQSTDTDKLLSLKTLLELMNEYSHCVAVARKLSEIYKCYSESQPEDYLASLNNIGTLLLKIPDYVEARVLLEQALDGYNKLLGPTSSRALETSGNLAAVLVELGDFPSALALLERTLEHREQVKGPDHPETTGVLLNLGLLCSRMNNSQQSRIYYERALDSNMRVLGPHHEQTLTVLNNLSVLYTRIGEPEKAIAAAKQCKDGFEKLFGPNHAETLGSLLNIGIGYFDLSNFVEAKEYLESAYQGFVTYSGENHITTLSALTNLAEVECKLGDYNAAYLKLVKAVDGFRAIGPSAIRKYIFSLDRLATLLYKLGYLSLAWSKFDELSEARETALGSTNLSTLSALFNSALCRINYVTYATTITDEERCSISEKASEIYERIAGAAQFSVENDVTQLSSVGDLWFDSLSNNSLIAFNKGDNSKCLELLERCYNLRCCYYGEENEQTIEAKATLEKHREAASLCSRQHEFARKEINHPVHPHPLQLTPPTASYYGCDVCGAGKVGLRYWCKRETHASEGDAEAEVICCDCDVCMDCCEPYTASD